ncbi:putative DeoR-family transcriptional regulator [Leifsonia rubra CMS 76R]|nr:putative DeoR-family transcriptional regulator [Leifsonia rubra CMS 76R]
MPVAKVPNEERLFSLVLALLSSEGGLTKSEILSTVQGYRQRFVHSGDNSNLERQFERDKDDVRELGVPLETIESPEQAGNNHNLRYRIPRADYELPEDISFSAEESTLLGLAAMVWREGSLSEESRRAIVKLRSLGIATAEPVLSYAPQLRVREQSFEPLRSALDKSVYVTFDYLKPGEQTSTPRTVAPLALVQHQGRWHLYAKDPAVDRFTTFLLRRIVGSVRASKNPCSESTVDAAVRALAELDEVWQTNVAIVRVEPGTDAATRLSKRRGTATNPATQLELHFTDFNIFADELASFGPEVLVVSPPALRQAVVARLTRTAADHG